MRDLSAPASRWYKRKQRSLFHCRRRVCGRFARKGESHAVSDADGEARRGPTSPLRFATGLEMPSWRTACCAFHARLASRYAAFFGRGGSCAGNCLLGIVRTDKDARSDACRGGGLADVWRGLRSDAALAPFWRRRYPGIAARCNVYWARSSALVRWLETGTCVPARRSVALLVQLGVRSVFDGGCGLR